METITDNSTTATAEANAFPSNPFVGLRPFESDEALLFFGRREQTVELLQQLHRTHFIAVVGSSGCGKSSLVRAGLIPKLKAGFLVEDLDQWRVAVMKPGDGPIRNLAAALLGAVSGEADAQEVERLVENIGQFGAEAILMRLAPALYDSSNLLLLVDQFEEIFRFGVESGKSQQRAEAEDFVSIMLALSQQRKLPIYVVMTMRSDFLGDCDNFYGLPEAMNQSQYLVPRLTRQQRQQAIEGPIRLFGASITPRLLDRVLNDVGDQSDQLPVMQHALLRTWENWRQSSDPQVDLIHYQNIGTIKHALSIDADNALKSLSNEDHWVAIRMFQALVGTDAHKRDIRRPQHLSEIKSITGASFERILEIVKCFQSSGRSFLTLTKDLDPLIDISHESLIRQWGTWRKRGLYPRPSLLKRLLAECTDRLIALFVIAPITTAPMLLIGKEYFTPMWLLLVAAWHLLRDASPDQRSSGKKFCRLRVVMADGRDKCSQLQLILRRSGSAVSQLLYALMLAMFFPSREISQSAIGLAKYIFSLFGANSPKPSVLMLCALIYDIVSLIFILITSSAQRPEELITRTRVISESAYLENRIPCIGCRRPMWKYLRYCEYCGADNYAVTPESSSQ